MSMKTKRSTLDFEAFWKAYGLKRNRIGAENAWKRLSAKDRRAAVAGIQAYREKCAKSGIAMMYGQGYLSHRRWEDEEDSQAAVKAENMSSPSDALAEMDLW